MVSPAPSPRRGRGTKGRNAPATRARLLRAAVELFPHAGYDGTTTPLLAARAGVAEGTIYRHFPDKNQLFNEALHGVVTWMRDTWRLADDPRLGTGERLRLGARRLAESAARDPAAARMFLVDWPTDRLDERSLAAIRALWHDLVGVVASGKQAGQIRSGPAELWAGVWEAVIRSGLRRVAGQEWGPGHPNLNLLIEAAWDAIRGDPRDPGSGPAMR